VTHETQRVRVEEYALCQQTSPKRWFGNMNMTSNCDVINRGHEVEMIIICHWMNPSHMKIFCLRLC